MPEHDQADHEGLFPASKRSTSKKLKIAVWILQIKEESFIDQVGFCDVLVWSLNTNEVHEVAMANF